MRAWSLCRTAWLIEARLQAGRRHLVYNWRAMHTPNLKETVTWLS